MKQYIKDEARRLGFDACGVSKAGFLENEARDLEAWLHEGRHGTMTWMENHFDKRTDPRILVEGAKSVISLTSNYYQKRPAEPEGKVSIYALGDDYHDVLRSSLKELFYSIEQKVGELNGRVFVDSAPVMDKAWAKNSGLGWQGKNTNLINRDTGSFFFIAEIISDLELEPDGPIADYCGSCTRCIDACPTGALDAPYQIEADKCISYLTIEHRGDDISKDLAGQIGDWIFGCDICQDVCPWNKFSKQHTTEEFTARPAIVENTLEQWEELEIEGFREIFRRNPVKRTKYEGFMRNVGIVRRNR